MTGFGKAKAELSKKNISIEIKSLNSKQFDLNTKIPSVYRAKEIEIRTFLLQKIQRGKVDFSIQTEHIGKNSSTQINHSAVENYCKQIKDSAEKLDIELPSDWFSILLRLPDTFQTELVELDEEEWKIIFRTIEDALVNFKEFRVQEGKVLEKIFSEKINNIAKLLKEVETYETERIDKVRNKIQDALLKLKISDIDQNRFEQELVYYIEKLDINEEKVRLENHLKYFLETMTKEEAQGRKLGFIIQEIGREINTLGSKSNHLEMQKIVVQMKDELEQIKEQILNVL